MRSASRLGTLVLCHASTWQLGPLGNSKMTLSTANIEECAKTIEALQASVQRIQPEDFIGNRQDVAAKCLEILKTIYDFSKSEEPKTSTVISGGPLKKKRKQQISITEAPLSNLVTHGFDNEQIWEEVQLQNNYMYENLVSSVSKLLAHQQFIQNVEGSSEDEDGGEEDEVSGDEAGLSGEFGDAGGNGLGSVEDHDDDEGSEEEDELMGDEMTEEKLSTYAKKSREIEEKIESIEDEALQPKSWQHQGEVTGQTRPENALLEEHLAFDHLIRQAPEITTETTLKLEDIIKQRIKDQAWDDVERKIKPVDDPYEFKKKLVLDAEKSKVGLAELYEQEYLKRKRAEDGEEKEETVPEEEIKIQKDLDALFAKLDALSNFHFTPKAPSAEIKVITNQPTVAMEEVAPVSVSDATLLAPQEIEEQAPGEMKGKAERSDTDRKRERRIKKKKQHVKRVAREEKAKLKGLGLSNIKLADNMKKAKSSKSKEISDASNQNSKELKSSKAFFAKLQNQVQSHIQKVAEKKKTDSSSKISAKRFKM